MRNLDDLERRLDEAIMRGDISETEAREIMRDAEQSQPDYIEDKF